MNAGPHAARRRSAASFAFIALDPDSPVPLYRQIYEAVSSAVLSRRLVPGTLLPSTRAVAADLGVSRNTAVAAFEQLLAEGFITGRVGSGTYVAEDLPDDLLRAAPAPAPARAAPAPARLSSRGRELAALGSGIAQTPGPGYAFRIGTPALDQFPVDVWRRLVDRRFRQHRRELLGYMEPAGYRPLRGSIADYLRAARGVACDADHVIVTAGSQQAIGLACEVLLDPGDPVWLEEPGYLGARSALTAAGARVVPVPVDADGLVVEEGLAREPAARAVYVSPSNQHPLGVTMSLARRLRLLDWASRACAWVFEDDYDSEYRYEGRPLTSLQGLDAGGRVLYFGTFSKVLFPALRLSYVVAPGPVAAAMVASRVVSMPPSLEQMALADFIAEGHFVRHIRRMRALYAERRGRLIDELARGAGGLFRGVLPAPAGMFLVAELPRGVSDVAVAGEAAASGVEVQPLSAFYAGRPVRSGLLLGYACVGDREMRSGVRSLAAAVRAVAGG